MQYEWLYGVVLYFNLADSVHCQEWRLLQKWGNGRQVIYDATREARGLH